MTQILHVEDSRVAHAAVLKLFRGKGLEYAVDWAATVSEGMKLLGERPYDLILLDYMLPDGTGFDLLEKAKDTPVVFFTGQGSENMAVQAMKQGAYDYVTKDLDGAYLEILPTVIAKAMEVVKLVKEKEELERRLSEELEVMTGMNKMLVGREAKIEELKNENKLMKKYISELERKV